MCDRCPDDSYGSAYQGSKSVTVKLRTFCKECQIPVEAEAQIHFGGEFWQPSLRCKQCNAGLILSVYVSDVNGTKVIP